MGKTLEVFETTSGTRVKKVEASDGRVMRFADGKPIKPRSYGAYKSHKPDTEHFKRGNIQDIDSVDELGNEYKYSSTDNTYGYEVGTDERSESTARNQWVGFLMSEETPDDEMEAAKQYNNMLSDLNGENDPEKQEAIKESYNIGGS